MGSNKNSLPHFIHSWDRRFRRIRNRFVATSVILLYHRVARPALDPQLMSVSPEHFDQHMSVLRERAHPVSLEKLTHSLRTRQMPPRRVVITFDDGYVDNLVNAKLILEKYKIPAIFFMCTGHLTQEFEFYWDVLERLFLSVGALPRKLSLNIRDWDYEWELGDFASYDAEQSKRYREWNVEEKQDPTSRHALYRFLCNTLRSLDPSERRRIIDELVLWAGRQSDTASGQLAMSQDEMLQLTAGDLITVGAHTLTHPILANLSPDVQRKEIQSGRNILENVMNRPVTSFAYPYGGHSHYSQETVRIVKQAGFSCACSNFPGAVWRSTNPFELPRFVVRDWDGDEFARHLEEWFYT